MSDGGAVTLTTASFDAQITTDANGTGPGTSAANRDLILGITRPSSVGFPGMVAMSKLQPAGSVVFGQGDLAGPWRVYLQRVAAKLQGSTTQIGQLTFNSAGAFAGGTLLDASMAVTSLTTGSLLVSANGSVTGSLNAGALASLTVDRYTFTGTMRAGKDLITGVITARLSNGLALHHGLVTLVREVALLDFGVGESNVTEGSLATVTVLRTGNREGTVTVGYAATAGTAGPGDFTATSGTLTFGPGVASRSFTVPTTVNTVVNTPRDVNLALMAPVIVSAPTGVTVMLGATATAKLNIVDNDLAGTVRLSTATYNVTEATANASIVIQRTGTNLASGVVVQLVTADDTAEAGRDYTARNVSVTFNAGETTKTVAVPITNTTLVDGPRSFTVTISAVGPASLAVGSPSTATVTITDNDVGGSLQFSLSAYSVSEPTGVTSTALITVSRTGGTAGGVLVDFATANGSATAGADYAATTGTLTFGAGNTSQTFTIPIFVDSLVEGDETILLTLSNPQGGGTLGARTAATLTIKDAQRGLQFSAANFTVNENLTTATVTVVRSGPATGTATVSYSTSDGLGDTGALGGTHYTPTSGTLTFGNLVTSRAFTVRILPDRVAAGAKTVLLVLSNPTPGDTQLGPQSSATLTINNVDVAGTIKLGAATYSANESLARVSVTVMRTGGAAGGVTVDYTTADDCTAPPCAGKAQAGVDYEATLGTLSFGPGETTKTVPIPITNDTIVEGSETFLFRLTNPQGGAVLGTPVTATATIVDNDTGGAIQLSAATYTVTEAAGVTGTATVDATITLTRTGTNLASGASVQFATSNGTAAAGSDYTATVTTVVFGAGETSKTVSIPILADSDVEGNETVNIALSSPGGGATLGTRKTAVLTIVDGATSSVQFSVASYTVNEGGTATIIVVRGGATSVLARVDYGTQDTADSQAGRDYRTTAGRLTFAPGVTSLTFAVPTLRRVADNGNRSVTLTLTPFDGGIVLGPRAPATLLIQDVDPAGTFQFGAAAYGVVEGGVSPVFITRSSGSGGTVVVEWSVVAGGNATVVQDYTAPTLATARRLTFGPGITSQRVPITIVNDTLAEDSETVVLSFAIVSSTTAGAVLGTPDTTTLTIQDNDNGGAIRFAAAAVTAAENVLGGRINLTVSRTGTALASGITVGYTAAGDTTAVNLPPGTLTFGAGQTALTLQVPIVTNTTAEPDRTVAITLVSPASLGGATGANAPTLGTVPTATATIVDDEPRAQFSASAYSVVEGGTATITVTRTGALAATATVNFTTANGTALAGTDYTTAAGVLTFGSNVTSRTFTVATADDPAATGAKTVTLQLTPAVGASIGARSTATLSITDGDSAGVVKFATATASVVEGGVVRVTVARTGSNLTGGVSVDWSATGGTATEDDDFSPASGSLTFAPGVTSQSFDITVVGNDGLAEGTETIVLSLGAPAGGATLGSPSATTVFIVDAEQSVALSSATYSQGETVTPAAISIVRLGVPTGEAVVRARTVTGTAIPGVAEAQPGLDYTAASTLLTFAPGEIVKTLNVPILTANALSRSGNRALNLALSDNVGAELGVRDTATLTILDFRPDLVVATVTTPSGTLAGKLVSSPTTVRNLGMVPAPAFRVGIFLAQDDLTPGAGVLLALRDVAALAPGASVSLPTSITVDDDTPPGDYYVSAVADFQSAVGEADENNNGLVSFPSFLRVARNLTKFQAATATLSQTSPPAGLQAPGGGLAANGSPTCDAQGVLNLSGSFTVTSQTQRDASGIADLTGTLNDAPVRYVITFDGTADANDNLTATLTSITVSGAVMATGNGSFVGTLDGRTLTGMVSGQIQTSTGGSCVFSGTLTAVGTTSYLFRFGTEIRPGTFGFGLTPDITFPVTTAGYAAGFTVLFDRDPAPPSTVRFTGPAGSGLSSTPADPEHSEKSDDGTRVEYVSPPRTGIVPGGTWSVAYKGTNQTFSVPPLDIASRVVVLVPTLSVDANSMVTRVTWEYRSRNGSAIAAPSFIRSVQVVIDGSDHQEVRSPRFDRSTTTFDLGGSPVPYAEIREIGFEYTDLAGNVYFIEYPKAFNIRVEARLEKTYGPFSPGGDEQRLLHVFVNTPAGSVERDRCLPNPLPPFPVTIVNETAATEPFADPTCIERTGTTQFDMDGPLTDIFSERLDLDDRAVPYPLAVGTGFNFSVTPLAEPGSPRNVVARLRNAEANPATDFISIPNTAANSPAPTGFTLADARLGQNMTVSWTLPSFPVAEQRFSPIVNSVDGRFCSGEQQDLPPGTTSTTFRFPAHCDNRPVITAQFCVFFTGEAADGGGRESSAACWFFFAGSNEAVGLSHGTATFSEDSSHTPVQSTDGSSTDPFLGWSIRNASTTASQTAVWETDFDVDPGVVTFTMNFAFGVPDHTIGRFRFSVTNADRTTFADDRDRNGDVLAPWTVLMNPAVSSSDPSMTFTVLADGSVLAANPSGQSLVTYTVSYTNTLARTTGIRLEVLEHPSLPNNGPGLEPGGNFVLTELMMDNRPAGGMAGLGAPSYPSMFRAPRGGL